MRIQWSGGTKNGISECYYNQDGFYDDKWEMQSPPIVLQEINRLDENLLKTENEEIIKKSKEVITLLISLINIAVEKTKKYMLNMFSSHRKSYTILNVRLN